MWLPPRRPGVPPPSQNTIVMPMPTRSTLTPLLILLLSLPAASMAQDKPTDAPPPGSWTGSGEFGFAAASGNSHTENINAKLGLSQENERWKNNFSLTGLRSKGDVSVVDSTTGAKVTQFSTTANRYEAAASVGYKFDPRSYVVGAMRYDHDDFGSNLWQSTISIGYGYIALKNARAELSLEAGPGYKRYRPANAITSVNGVTVTTAQPVQSEAVLRSLINGKLRLTANTRLEDTLLIEAGSDNTYLQNDAGLSVSMTEKLALKLGLQVRYNSHVQAGTEHSDKLLTTNLVYSF